VPAGLDGAGDHHALAADAGLELGRGAAGGDPATLMTTLAPTLAAISAGSVFMGANSYIGNAPNLMVKAIAEDRGVRMPSFFGYMAWSGACLIPLFVLVTFIFFR
jgi:Na+/H+ antiporter NhaD/arsenite permease-like protein